MNKKLCLPIFFLVLSGCNITNSSNSGSSSISSIPVPTDDFNPLLNGRLILKETVLESTFDIENSSPLTPLPLFEFNFPAIEDITTAYAVAEALPGHFENQVLDFSSTLPIIPAALTSLNTNQTIEDQAVIPILENLQPSDERFNNARFYRKHRDLSHVYFGSEYFWFNQFVEEEEMVITRYPNAITYGQWQMNKMYQTEVVIPIAVTYQLYADATTIYEIRDETYPSGFFGAQDTKYETIRTEDNFKLALTMGPITTLLQHWQVFERNQTPLMFPFHGDISSANRHLSVLKLGENDYEFRLQVYLGNTFETAEENYQIRAILRGSDWESVQQHYQLWQPTAIHP